jgi:prepilin-type N-terminal cleavage/methylation domain-containing protein
MKRYPTRTTRSANPVSRRSDSARLRRQQVSKQAGFTLLETTIALLLMLIVALGSASLFSFSIYNNSGGSDRAVSLALAQQALETLRSAPFTTTTTDARLNAGTLVQNGLLRNGKFFRLTTIVDDNPATAAVDVVPTSPLKSITISVQPTGKGWGSGASGTVTLITQRARAD